MADGLEIALVVSLEFFLVFSLAGNLAAGLVGNLATQGAGSRRSKVINRGFQVRLGGTQSRSRTIGIDSDSITTCVAEDPAIIWLHLQSDLFGEVEGDLLVIFKFKVISKPNLDTRLFKKLALSLVARDDEQDILSITVVSTAHCFFWGSR